MTRKDLVSIVKTKENKANSTKAVSFWEGVLATLKEACRVKTFRDLDQFKEFTHFAKANLKAEELIYRNCIQDQKRSK